MPLFINKFVTFSLLFFFKYFFLYQNFKNLYLSHTNSKLSDFKSYKFVASRSSKIDPLCLIKIIFNASYLHFYFFYNFKKISVISIFKVDFSTSMVLSIIFHQTQWIYFWRSRRHESVGFGITQFRVRMRKILIFEVLI